MKVIKVDGNVFLANFADNKLTDAMSVGNGAITNDYRSRMGEYVMARNVSKLMNMDIGTHSAVASRDLTAEEEIVLKTAEANMGVAKTQAVRQLENDYFKGNF